MEADSNSEQNCACLPDHKFLCIRLIKHQKGNENIKLPRRGLPFPRSASLKLFLLLGKNRRKSGRRRRASRRAVDGQESVSLLACLKFYTLGTWDSGLAD